MTGLCHFTTSPRALAMILTVTLSCLVWVVPPQRDLQDRKVILFYSCETIG